METAFKSFAAGFPFLIIYLLAMTAIFLVGLVTYVKLTPYKELELVQEGNMAAAITFSSLVVSLSLPLGACLVGKYSIEVSVVWGLVSLLLQLLLFRVTDAVFKGMPERIARGEVPAATVFASFKIAGSILLAFAIAG